MTKLEILKSVDKAFTSEVLDKFYSVDITSEKARLQGCYRTQIMMDIKVPWLRYARLGNYT